ncbi:recombinase family protein [Phenylobacterium sp.]|uniref:recombinase family protein n=1 Tax=Phenylobacterium sp. TaxID=1871053 RepID=UPI002C79729C|nr:recombinase family protein [Phenylobacterium sp.]HLZ77165.1 recombinase family protein [Phenylobacterium sp.]
MDPRPALTPAAQYVRMSTDHQRYSIENQTRVIGEYAVSRGYEVVQTYTDDARSGLTLRGRPALSQLLADVVAGDLPYSTILVQDISRWGRFQDLDESAHYEFICRSSGVAVRYCAEPFDNDGSIYSSIVKQLKRVMAAEYSRELSAKVARAMRLLASKGYRMSGSPGFGIRRLVLDECDYPLVTLEQGQRKAVQGHRIMLVPGPPEEVAVVRQIFHLRVVCKLSMVAIADQLNANGVQNEFGRPWGEKAVKTVLTNEKYIGNNIFGYLNKRLGGKAIPQPPETWVRFDEAFPPIVDRKLFMQARRLIPPPKLLLTDDELLKRLRALWQRTGMLSRKIIGDCKTIPNANTYIKRFGSLSATYRLIGYDHKLALQARHRGLTDQEMLERLAWLLAERGKLSHRIVDGETRVPASITYAERFGSLYAAFRLIGHFPPYPSESRRRLAWKYSDAGMMEGLRALYERHNYLSLRLINADPAIPCYSNYQRRFGSIKDLYFYLGVGYQPRQIASRERGADGKFLDRARDAKLRRRRRPPSAS